jgi:hypothetical protein
MVLGALAVLRALVSQPAERLRALGMLLFLAGSVGVALSIGWGRGGLGPTAGFMSRYTTLALPGLCAVYFAVALYGGRLLGGFTPMALFAGAVLFLPMNNDAGRSVANNHRDAALAFRADVRAGMPANILAERYAGVLHPSAVSLERSLLALQKAGVADFASGVRPSVALPSVVLGTHPLGTTRTTWEGETAFGRGEDSSLDYTLPPPLRGRAVGVRLRCRFTDGVVRLARFRVFWKSPDGDGGEREQTMFVPVLPNDGEKDVVFWTGGPVATFRLVPDEKSWACQVSDLRVLVSAEERATP